MKNVLPISCLRPLTEIQADIEAFAAKCAPDHVCLVPRLHDELRFHVLDLDAHPSAIGGMDISLLIEGVDHLFNLWSRKQLLDHLGTREKWFERVSLEEQARELTRRIHTFDRHMFRIVQGNTIGLNMIRGLVSSTFADIPDTEIMEALVKAVPDGSYIASISNKTDKALYVYVVEPSTTLRLGPTVTGFPGAVIRNSEVGYTALSLVPYFVIDMGGWVAPIALRRQAKLRRIHRGQVADLHLALKTALTELQAVWGPMQQRLDGLLAKSFVGEKEAIERLQTILAHMKRTKSFIEKATTTYSAAKNTAHNGLTILMAMLTACATTDIDQQYDEAEVAGYFLLHIV